MIKNEARQWLRTALDKGFIVCILSNSMKKRRVQEIATALGVLFCENTSFRKPSKKAYFHAIDLMGGTPEASVMIGDQVYTDITGAAKAHIDGILVDPIYKREALGTRIWRLRERLAGRVIRWQDEK